MDYPVSNQIKISPATPDFSIDRCYVQLQTLIATIQGTLPGTRGFGIPVDPIDNMEPQSLNMLGLRVEEAMEKWIPALRVARIQGILNSDGTMGAEIFVEARE